MKPLLLMITFFIAVPINYPYDYNETDFIKGMKLIPIVGLIIGIFIYIPTLLENYIDRPILILIVWTTYLFLTGGLHIDGLADTFDGIFSRKEKEEMLKVMRDSRIGTIGAISIVWILILNVVLLYYIENKIFIIIPVIGRVSVLITTSISKYARKEGGLGKIFVDNCSIKESLIGIIFSFAIGLIVGGISMIVPMFITIFLIIVLTKYVENKLGGITGDTIGAIIEISQTLFMFFYYISSFY